MERSPDRFWRTLSVILLVLMAGMVGVILWQSQGSGRAGSGGGGGRSVKGTLAAVSPSLMPHEGERFWISDLAEKALPYVVNIETKATVSREDGQSSDQMMRQMQQMFPFQLSPEELEQFNQQMPEEEASGVGSGFIMTADGYIVTNSHVVSGGDEFIVHFYDGNEMEAKLVGQDDFKDIAVLKVNAKDLPVAPLGDSSKVRIGEPVIAIGSPIGYQATVTAGIISANNRKLADLGGIGTFGNDIRAPQTYLQTDAAINRGNSGGPLINADGAVIGVNQAIARRDQVSAYEWIPIEGIGFAIPIDEVKDTIDQIVQNGSVAYPGISAQIISVEDYLSQNPSLSLDVKEGVYVVSMKVKGPADKAGIKAGDVILSIDGQKVGTAEDFIREINTHKVNDRVVLRLSRQGGKTQEDVSVVLEKLDLGR